VATSPPGLNHIRAQDGLDQLRARLGQEQSGQAQACGVLGAEHERAEHHDDELAEDQQPGEADLGGVVNDLHGDNQVWDHDELRLVVDFETAGAAEPEYDLRTFPGPGLELLTAVMSHYQQITARQLSADRIMAWHVRTALGDVLWRSEAGIPLGDHRTPPEWVEDLATRFSAFGIDPEAIGRSL
jgi:hypothetical protein